MMVYTACACDCDGGECGHGACAAATDDEQRAPPRAAHTWRRCAGRCAAAALRRCDAFLRARFGAHMPSALIALLCIALLCRALSFAGDDAQHGSSFVALRRPCTATLIIRRELLPGSPAPRVTVNGASPGPVLRCALGHSVRYTVVNQLPDDATTVHWHGLGQRGTPWADGVVGVSQCPIPNVLSKNTLVYEFTPDRAGTFWYHGHFHEQYADGLYGALIISSPDDDEAAAAGAAAAAALPVDEDEWVWVLADAYDVPVTSLLGAYLSPPSGGVEPTPDAITVNGMRPGGGFRIAAARAGPPVRLRLINAGTVSMFTFSVDGLPLMLVELDGTPVQPLPLRSLTLAVAQRASVILDWSRLHADVAASPGLWARVEAAVQMYGAYDAAAPDGGLRGTAGGAPLNTRWTGLIAFNETDNDAPSYASPPALPAQHPGEREGDANLLAATPRHAALAPPPTHVMALDVVFAADAASVNRAYINGATTSGPSAAQLSRPALHAAALDGVRKEAVEAAAAAPRGGVTRVHGDAVTPFVVPRGAVVDVLLNNTDDGEHPFHLHGHAVWVLATSEQPEAEAAYAARGYVLRDIVSVPASGWAKLRFVADNPGAWIFHCHIEFHVRAGLVSTVLEAPEALRGMRLPAAHAANCANYRESIAAAE